jgi:hypothetical protein
MPDLATDLMLSAAVFAGAFVSASPALPSPRSQAPSCFASSSRWKRSR